MDASLGAAPVVVTPWPRHTCTRLPFCPGGNIPEDQVHIRDAQAAQLARALAHQTSKTIRAVVLDALRQYRRELTRLNATLASSFGTDRWVAIARC